MSEPDGAPEPVVPPEDLQEHVPPGDPQANPYASHEGGSPWSEEALPALLIETSLWRRGGWKLAAILGLTLVFFVVAAIVGGEMGAMAVTALEVAPFVLLAILAYLGAERWWMQPLAIAYLLFFVLGMALVIVLLTFMALNADIIGGAKPNRRISLEGLVRFLTVCTAVFLAVNVAATSFVPAVRRAAARRIPLDPQSFVHTIALAMVAALTLISLAPLLVLPAPPMLALVETAVAKGEDLAGGRGHAGMLRDELYGLAWLVPGAIIAVGYGLRRDLRESLSRLGLVVPTVGQVALAVGAAVVMLVGVAVLSDGVDWLWTTMGWPTTNAEVFDHLMQQFMTPLGALTLGIVAGLGEELAVRGALQPRLGIFLSNAFFTSLHAFQYHWDALVVVFIIGLGLGVLREKTNTTTTAITHGLYDFLLVLAAAMEIPWFSD